MSDILGYGNKQDKWTIQVTSLINKLNEEKQALLIEGSNITLTPLSDGTVQISATGGGGGGASALNDLSDVNISSPLDGQVLMYDANNSEWVNGTVQGGGCSNGTGWEKIATNSTTASWTQNSEELVFFHIYWNDYALYAVHVGKNGTTIHGTLLASGGNIGGNPTFSYDGTTHTVTATWAANNDVQIFRGTVKAIKEYSLNEQYIGKWVDDKDLYEKTYYLARANGNTDTTIDNTADLAVIDRVTYINGTALNNYGEPIPIPNSYSNANINCGVTITSGGIRITVGSFFQYLSDVYITLRYTKQST